MSVALEKAQVAVLAERLATLLLALRQGGVAIGEESSSGGTAQLAEPLVEQFRVGTLTLGWDGERERVVIEAQEITDEEEVTTRTKKTRRTEGREAAEEASAAFRRFCRRTRPRAGPAGAGGRAVFASGAVATCAGGPAAVSKCGAPLDPTGHFCPRRNGYQN